VITAPRWVCKWFQFQNAGSGSTPRSPWLENPRTRNIHKIELFRNWKLNLPVWSLDWGEFSVGLRSSALGLLPSAFSRVNPRSRKMQKNQSCQNWNFILPEWSPGQGESDGALNFWTQSLNHPTFSLWSSGSGPFSAAGENWKNPDPGGPAQPNLSVRMSLDSPWPNLPSYLVRLPTQCS